MLVVARPGLNERADALDFYRITQIINGGTHGIEQRRRYWERAKQIWTEEPA